MDARATPAQIIDRYVVDLFDPEEIDAALRAHGYPEGIAVLNRKAG